jgi:hypothetical protein
MSMEKTRASKADQDRGCMQWGAVDAASPASDNSLPAKSNNDNCTASTQQAGGVGTMKGLR